MHLADQLNTMIAPRFVAFIEARVSIEPIRVRAIPRDISEPYIALIRPKSDQRVVALIEVISPSNKAARPGRRSYRAKQKAALKSDSHLIEIDLLRLGRHLAAVPEFAARGGESVPSFVSVNRAGADRRDFEVYRKGLRDRLPRFALQLADGARDIPVDLQAAFAKTYESGSFRDTITYDPPCVPPLSPDDQTWADGLIRAALGA